MLRYWLVKNTRALTRTLGRLVVNREKSKKPKQHQPHHSLHFVSCLQSGQNYSILSPNRTKRIIKLEMMGKIPEICLEEGRGGTKVFVFGDYLNDLVMTISFSLGYTTLINKMTFFFHFYFYFLTFNIILY